MINRDPEPGYNSPVTVPVSEPASDQDEYDYSTLIEVEKILADALTDLYSDFNAFNEHENLELLDRDIRARKAAYDILMPIQDAVATAIHGVKKKTEV